MKLRLESKPEFGFFCHPNETKFCNSALIMAGILHQLCLVEFELNYLLLEISVESSFLHQCTFKIEPVSSQQGPRHVPGPL